MSINPSDPGRQIVAALEKSACEELIVDVQEFNGRPYFGIRVYDLHGGRRVPTTKGVTLHVEMLPALIDALQRAQAAAFSAPISAHGE